MAITREEQLIAGGIAAGGIAWRAFRDDHAPLAAFYVYQCLKLLIQLQDVVSHILQ